jgi:predicted house-cleaning NTP pyrophosphatase (Maf/HAM1 superfamily)
MPIPIVNQKSIVRSIKRERKLDLGIVQQRRADVLKVLEVKFQTVPTEVIEKINKIEDPAILETLHQKAKALALMKQFLGYLQEIGC